MEWTRHGIEWEAVVDTYRLWIMPHLHLFRWRIIDIDDAGSLEIVASGTAETITETMSIAEKALAEITKEKP